MNPSVNGVNGDQSDVAISVDCKAWLRVAGRPLDCVTLIDGVSVVMEEMEMVGIRKSINNLVLVVIIITIKDMELDIILELVVIITRSMEDMELVAITASTTVLELVYTSTITEDTEV